jgi:hypothetical protein
VGNTVGVLKNILRRNAKEAEPLSVEELRCTREGATCIGDLQPRAKAEVVGEVEHVCTVNLDGAPAFEISVKDATGSLVALFTGRSSIECVVPGRRIALYGRVAPMRREDSLLVQNPRYELLS